MARAKPWQKSDEEILDWLGRVMRDEGVDIFPPLNRDDEAKRGWTVTAPDMIPIGTGTTLRMALSDAMHHPELLPARVPGGARSDD